MPWNSLFYHPFGVGQVHKCASGNYLFETVSEVIEISKYKHSTHHKKPRPPQNCVAHVEQHRTTNSQLYHFYVRLHKAQRRYSYCLSLVSRKEIHFFPFLSFSFFFLSLSPSLLVSFSLCIDWRYFCKLTVIKYLLVKVKKMRCAQIVWERERVRGKKRVCVFIGVGNVF